MSTIINSDLSSLRCAVLGAGGFIGTNLCRSLVKRVETVRAFGRRQIFPGALEGCVWIPGNFSDPTSLLTAVDGCDVVFHLVNSSTPSSANMDMLADLNANVVSALHFLNICHETSVRRVVFVSSGGTVYGVPDCLPTTEAAPTNPITAYGISKLAIEKYLAIYERLHGLEYRVLRVANPFGPYQTALKNQGVIAAFLSRALAGKPIEIWGDGSVVRDYIYIGDVVEALISAAIHQGAGRIFNISSREGRSINEIVASINEILGIETKIVYRPGRMVDVPITLLDNTFAERELGWRPRVEFMNGLLHTIKWAKENFTDYNR